MDKRNKLFTVIAAFFCIAFFTQNIIFAQECQNAQISGKYPDYSNIYLGKDKFEGFNRKMFMFNGFLNKYALRPAHIVWASVMPKYGMDRIQSAYENIEYPKRLVSCLLQKDFKASKNETIRFLTNTTIGLGGMFDPAKKLFKIEPVKEDLDQALAKCKVKQGPYLVLPIISSTTPRALAGKAIESALDPTLYFASPVTTLIKLGLLVNKTSFMQPLSKMIESTYADPYDIVKKLYGLESFIKHSNFDRKEVLDDAILVMNKNKQENDITVSTDTKTKDEAVSDIISETAVDVKLGEETEKIKQIEPVAAENKEENKIAANEIIKGGAFTDSVILNEIIPVPDESELIPDIVLDNYYPQNPVVDSMRTALFDLPEVNDSMWTELSVWNRCFSKKIKTSDIEIEPDREKYTYKFVMQKDKNSPLAIIYPSIGEGVTSHHSVVLAKIFYDAGYSVIIQGSHFHWEFIKSMPKSYRPGLPSKDAHYLRIVTGKIINALEKRYECKFKDKVVFGTSFGAMTTLFLADKESRENTLGIKKFISINPPIELLYALKELDKNNEEWHKNPADLKNRVAITASKIIQIAQLKNTTDLKLETLPFSEEEGKLITGFIMHQKLSDLIFSIEDVPRTKCCKLYDRINNMNYRDYAEKYLVQGENKTFDDLNYNASLHSIANYLKNNNNYRIYHTLDDYFTNKKQLKQLKRYTGKNTILISNGAHLGFLYRKEFLDSLNKDIAIKKEDNTDDKLQQALAY